MTKETSINAQSNVNTLKDPLHDATLFFLITNPVSEKQLVKREDFEVNANY